MVISGLDLPLVFCISRTILCKSSVNSVESLLGGVYMLLQRQILFCHLKRFLGLYVICKRYYCSGEWKHLLLSLTVYNYQCVYSLGCLPCFVSWWSGMFHTGVKHLAWSFSSLVCISVVLVRVAGLNLRFEFH